MYTDSIGDMVARIKNAYMAGHKVVEMPYSKMKLRIGEILAQEKYIVSAEALAEEGGKRKLKLVLRYQQKTPALSSAKRVSKPGLRVYREAKKLRNPVSGMGTGIISTSQGLMTVREAKKKKIGGELVCEVW